MAATVNIYWRVDFNNTNIVIADLFLHNVSAPAEITQHRFGTVIRFTLRRTLTYTYVIFKGKGAATEFE